MNQWRKASTHEQAQGFEAVNIVQESIHLGNGARVPYLRQYYYKHEALERRAKRGDSVPEWLVQPLHDLDAEWLDYLAGAEPSAAVLKKLETMGSYEQRESAA